MRVTETGIIAALALALPKLGGAKKDAANPAFKRNGKELGYATLGAVIEALEPLKEHGLWFLQVSHERENGACFETIAIHGPSSAQMSLGTMFVPADRNNAQGFGSAQTYCRRYGLMAAFGIAPEDDDGNAAAAAPPARQPKSEPAAVITDAQWMILTDLIEKTRTDAKAFCTAFKIGSVKEMPAARFEKARQRLNEKLAAMAPLAAEGFGDIDETQVPF
jgi:hypothetical protein